MSCPYSQPNCPELKLAADTASCPECLQFLKPCPRCGTRNRAFANFCRSCQTALSSAKGNWLSYKGSSQRLGLNLASPPGWDPPNWKNLEVRVTGMTLRLDDTCRSLLGLDRHLVAVSQSGTIEVCDPERPAHGHRLKADGPISCEPCIERGVLYLGSPGRLTAYSLGALTLPKPRLTALWQLPLAGTPIQGLIALDNRLYVTVSQRDGKKEVRVIEGLERNPPAAGRVIHSGFRLSWLAADPASRQVVFFSQEGKGIQLHRVSHGARTELTTRPLSVQPFAEQLPIAFVGGKIFGIFGEEDKLCRIDVQNATFEQALDPDIKLFALSQEGDHGWDGDGVQIDSTGITFLRSGVKDSFAPLDRVARGSPLILQGCAAVVGMQDGRILLYDMIRPARYKESRLTDDGEAITALASFQNYVAAGNARGVVRVLELRGNGVGD